MTTAEKITGWAVSFGVTLIAYMALSKSVHWIIAILIGAALGALCGWLVHVVWALSDDTLTEDDVRKRAGAAGVAVWKNFKK